MQWTVARVRKHISMASHSLFPAALKNQDATTAFQRMNREYSDAFVMQGKSITRECRSGRCNPMSTSSSPCRRN